MTENDQVEDQPKKRGTLSFSISKILEDTATDQDGSGASTETNAREPMEPVCSVVPCGLWSSNTAMEGSFDLNTFRKDITPNVLYSDVLFHEINRRLYGVHGLPVRRIGHPFQTRAPPKHKKPRTSFTKSQIAELEKRFVDQKYLASSERSSLASTLHMTDSQVKTWFQNRRTKWRRKTAEERERERQQAMKLFACNGNPAPFISSSFGTSLQLRPDVKI